MVNGILGESITFPLNIQESQQVVSIAWNSGTSVAFVVPGDAETAAKVTVTHQNYYKRVNVLGQSYNLEISQLTLEDAGIYKADINIKTSKAVTTITRCYNLQVYQKNVTYSWRPLGGEGNVLRIFQTPDNQELTYTCTAWNPVSNNSDSIAAQQLCAGIAMGFRARHAGLLSGLAALSLFVLIVPSLLLFLLCKRGQGSFLKIFNKNPDAQPAELRLYDEIPQSQVLPDKEQVNTIYSTVQYSDKGKSSIQDCKAPGTSSYEIVI
ncbi:hypothetical protein MC885_008742 [Smutsia gigantea]|nr:hypothetical protein MC885_008742 [Smutsia gigantea]